jgi:uncharacterized membrane protein
VSEEDESTRPATVAGGVAEFEDNSLGRLLTLADGIFAIAMTLLALDLKVPDLGSHSTDAALRHALAANVDSYLAFLLTFYVVGGYWIRHRRLMRSVVTAPPVLIRDSLFLLLLVAAMPFPASMLGRYGGEPISLSLYGAANALATLAIILMSWDIRRLRLSDHELEADDDFAHRWQSWLSCVVFLLCVPAGYVLGDHGPYVLVLLAVPDRLAWLQRLRARRHNRR